jgi:hypothetical protein
VVAIDEVRRLTLNGDVVDGLSLTALLYAFLHGPLGTC